MLCFPPSGYIIFSLRKLKFYGGRGPGPDNPSTLLKSPCVEVSFLIKLTEWHFTGGFISYSFKVAALKSITKVIGKHLWWALFQESFSEQLYNKRTPAQWKWILKNSYSGNSQKKVNRCFGFLLCCVLSQCGWSNISFHNWSVAGGGWRYPYIAFNCSKVVSSLVCHRSLQL